MTARLRPVGLQRITRDQVLDWFHKAWPNRPEYPDPLTCDSVATKINIIVDLEIGQINRKPSKAEYDEIREAYIKARKHARGFKRLCPQVIADLERRELSQTDFGSEANIESSQQSGLKAIRDAERALDAVLTLCRPPEPWKHRDPMEWIAEGAEQAWARHKARVPLGRKPDDALPAFVLMALKGLGLAGENVAGCSLETISDHLRHRQNRARSGRRRSSTE